MDVVNAVTTPASQMTMPINDAAGTSAQPHHPITNIEDATKDTTLYEHHKRPAPRPPSTGGRRDVYMKRDTSFVQGCRKVRRLIEVSKTPITMRAMGAAITRCCDVALAIQNDFGNAVTMTVETDTISVVDDFEPLSDAVPEVSKQRNISSISITFERTAAFV